MRSSNRTNILIAIAVLALSSIFWAGCTGNGDGKSSNEPISAVLDEITGRVQTLNPSEGKFINAFDGQGIDINYQVLTHSDSRARLSLSNGTIIRLSPFTTFVLEELERRDTGIFAKFKLEVGEIWIILNGGEIEVDSPAGLASVRGSYLQVFVDGLTKETTVTCLEGECTLGNDAGIIYLVAGQTGIVKNRNSIPTPGTMDAQDVSRWMTANPEATMIMMVLTETVSAVRNESSSGNSATATPDPSSSPSASNTTTPTQSGSAETPTATPTPTGSLTTTPTSTATPTFTFFTATATSTNSSTSSTAIPTSVPTTAPTATDVTTTGASPTATATSDPNGGATSTATSVPATTAPSATSAPTSAPSATSVPPTEPPLPTPTENTTGPSPTPDPNGPI